MRSYQEGRLQRCSTCFSCCNNQQPAVLLQDRISIESLANSFSRNAVCFLGFKSVFGAIHNNDTMMWLYCCIFNVDEAMLNTRQIVHADGGLSRNFLQGWAKRHQSESLSFVYEPVLLIINLYKPLFTSINHYSPVSTTLIHCEPVLTTHIRDGFLAGQLHGQGDIIRIASNNVQLVDPCNTGQESDKQRWRQPAT